MIALHTSVFLTFSINLVTLHTQENSYMKCITAHYVSLEVQLAVALA